MKYDLIIDGKRRSVEFNRPAEAASHVTLEIDGRAIRCDAVPISPGLYSILLDDRSFEVSVETAATALLIRAGNREFQVEIRDPRAWRRGRGGSVELEGRQQITAPMSGKVIRALVAQGETVEADQGILVVEAMKMQNEIRSPKSGTVEQLLVKEGQTVNSGELLAVIA
jgi:biotin carboxyl carrier protein